MPYDTADKKLLPNWVRKEELEMAEKAMYRHQTIYYIKVLVTWEDCLMLQAAHPEMKVFEQRYGYAFIEMCMDEYTCFDYMAWRFMDKRARANRECRFCGNEIPRGTGNLAYCKREHMEKAMRGEYGGQFEE